MNNDYMSEALGQRDAYTALKVIVTGQKKEQEKKEQRRKWQIEIRQRRKKGTL